jgi:hypothetical protein
MPFGVLANPVAQYLNDTLFFPVSLPGPKAEQVS